MTAVVYVTDEEPGIRRLGRTRLRYVDGVTGDPLRDAEELARIRSLAVPPAWTDVWICPDPRGHLQATGRDARGRKQYRYHPDYRRTREQAKFDELVPFGQALGALRSRIDDDLSRRGLPRERVVAVVVALLDRTYVRVGNEEYVRENGTFGLTTLRRRHATIDGGTITLRFKGKGAKVHEATCADPRLARLVRRCRELPGQHLFTYEEGGEVCRLTSSDVNDYLRQATGLDATAKTFRTWGASVMAAAELAAVPAEAVGQAGVLTGVVEQVADSLGNTPAVCRRSYIHPTVVEVFERGGLAERWREGPNRAAGGLDADERRLLHLLDQG